MVRPDDEFDVVVIGGGSAGWVAARRTQQLGGSVALVDRGPTGPGWSNSLLSGGRIHAAYWDPRTADPDALYERVLAKTDYTARPDVVRAFADNVGRAVNFLDDEGATIEALGEPEYLHTTLMGAPRRSPLFNGWSDGGPHRALVAMWHSFAAAGGTFVPGARARDLVLAGDQVVGVRIELADGRGEVLRGRKVIMADGGFQANPELVGQYVTRHAYRPHGSIYDVGDCLRMGVEHGARTHGMEAIYANLGYRDSLTNEALLLLTTPGELIDESVVVNSAGDRVGDEASGTEEWSIIDIRLATDVAKTDQPDCWIVFDDEVWRTTGTRDRYAVVNKVPGNPLNPGYVDAGGTFLTAPTIDELATGIGASPERLARTVATFNRFCVQGGDIDPPRTNRPAPIDRGPFHAIPLLVGIYFTMGGLLVNGDAQVLGADDRPIPNLYAAGGTMGGLQGGPRNGYAGGWSESLTFGLLAAEHAMKAG